MTSKNLTDEEIIKALEDYIKENEFEYFHSNMMSEYPLIRKSLDLINRKMEEIERLKVEIERIQKARLKQAQFLAEQKAQKYELINKLSRAKTESCKEFVERLKEK